MKCVTTYHRNLADTINGESITITQTYSSPDKADIDLLEKWMKESIGSGVISEEVEK